MVFKEHFFNELEKRNLYYHKLIDAFGKKAERELRGKTNQVLLKAKIAEKMAERAFNMASTANLGVVALQKALATPRLMTKQQTTANQLASNNIDKLFKEGGSMDWLRPILSDEELDVLDKAEEHARKHMNGTKEE